jgi:arylsulfatase A-like enzyme
MMTGVLPSRIGMDRNGPASFPVPDEILRHSLGHVFRRAGYQTVYGGKVHLTEQGSIDRVNLVSTGLDLIPTLCECAGIETPSPLTGRSVKPLTTSPLKRHPWRDSLVFENEGSRILVSERHKYVVYDHGEPREMLIDLKSDPGEINNLAIDPQHDDVLTQHRHLLRKWYEKNGETLGVKYIVAG